VPVRILLNRTGSDGITGGGTPSAARKGPVVQTDVDAFLASLDLDVFRRILAEELRDIDEQDPTVTMAALSIAIAARRIRAGRAVRLGGGRLRSLLDHPVAESAASIAAAVERAAGVAFGRMDVAAITESLLGLTQLVDVAARPEAADVRYIDRIIAGAAGRLHPSLGEDDQLRSSLLEHVRRLHVRLRFGLPISNPLQHEVRRRYPDVYRAAAEILAEVGPVAGAEMPVEEVGLLTMYLAGSLERHRLRPKVRVTVVCPAGMATAWILVSRLVAEFPQIEVIRVVSKAAFGIEPGEEPDLVVSTIPLEETPDGPISVVVSPLLREADIRRLGRVLGGLPA
jgi:transcriptional antiterminator